MKIMLDTNVLISAFVFGGQAGRLLGILFESEHELYVSDYVDREFKEKLEQKWPTKAKKVYDLYRQLDIPVLSDARYHKIDLILSGDKDFLEAGLEYPLVFSPAMMLEYLEKWT